MTRSDHSSHHSTTDITATSTVAAAASSSPSSKLWSLLSRKNVRSRLSIVAVLLAMLVWWQFDSLRRSTFSLMVLESLINDEQLSPVVVKARTTSTSSSNISSSLSSPQQSSSSSLLLLDHQIREQALFQRNIHELMHPSDCQTARILFQKRHDRKDSGFTCLLHVISRVLLVAMATKRTLVIADDWRSLYEPPNCTTIVAAAEFPNGTVIQQQQQRSFYECLWEPISHCKDRHALNKNNATQPPTKVATVVEGWTKDEVTISVGILPEKPRSTYFDVMYYGPERVVEAPSWPWKLPNTRNVDVVPDWERRYGRFWIRAQAAHYMWRPNPAFSEEITARLPEQLPPDTPFIGFHVRYTDNIKDLARDFGRDATMTRKLQRFMDIAEHIRQEFNPSIHTIYLATDNAIIVKQAQRYYHQGQTTNWTFVLQADVERTTSKRFFWYGSGRAKAAAGVATNVEVLRRADFLVGSFQSNVYRLAAELNLAYLSHRYPWSMQRHYTVDVEWYEDA